MKIFILIAALFFSVQVFAQTDTDSENFRLKNRIVQLEKENDELRAKLELPPEARERGAILHAIQQFVVAAKLSMFVDQNGNRKMNPAKFSDALAKINYSDCPADFQTAFTSLIQSFENLSTQNSGIAVAVGVLELLHGKANALSDYDKEHSTIIKSWLEVERISTQHGVNFTN